MTVLIAITAQTEHDSGTGNACAPGRRVFTRTRKSPNPREAASGTRLCLGNSTCPPPGAQPGRGNTGTGTLGVQLPSFLDKGHDPASGAALALLCGREDGLDVKLVLGGLTLARAPDFIDDWVP